MGDKLRKRLFAPRTPLGQRLWNIRARIVASGEPLLTWDDIDRELAERRGEREKRQAAFLGNPQVVKDLDYGK